MTILEQMMVYLAAAIVAVLVFNRLQLGSILGYLAAGVAIGPSGLGLINNVHGVLHIAEFGVVLLLFLIGLELQPSRLWAMRGGVFGLGGMQVSLSVVPLAVLFGSVLDLPWQGALAAGAGLSLSSTALALQLLAERDEMGSHVGRGAFGILLFQDLAVIFMMALVPLLAGNGVAKPDDPLVAVARVFGVVALLVGGKYVLKPVLRLVARQRSQELFTAAALAMVVGTALLMETIGLSMALGAFLAGVLLSDTPYRHEFEADIAPFKGLLLGLFFIAVGMGVDVKLLLACPGKVVGCAAALVIVKTGVLWAVARRSLGATDGLSLATLVSQGGEFAYVLFRLSVAEGALTEDQGELLVLVVTLSMATTPLIYGICRKLPPMGKRRTERFEVAPPDAADIVIAGFGRVGGVVGRILRAKKIRFTALDIDPEHIDFLKQFGARAFYGDAARLDLLRAARVEEARVFVLAIDDVPASVGCARLVMQNFPHITIIARARNREHAYELMGLGIKHVVRETLGSTLQMTELVLQAEGLTFEASRSAIERFSEHDKALMERTLEHAHDRDKMLELSRMARGELERLFAEDARERV